MSEDVRTHVDREELRAIVAQALDLPAADVTDEADFREDLEVDSLMALEIMVLLERRYGIKLDESELEHMTSLERVDRLVTAKIGS
jgi:acyl carrier protein